MKIVAVIPAYNEAENISSVVSDALRFVDQVVVVDDASSDATAGRAREAGAHVVQHLVNRDQGAALQTGDECALVAGADIIVHIDADGQHQARNIPAMVQPIIAGSADVVFGSRFLGQSADHIPRTKRYLIHPLARLINRLFTGLTLSDAHNGWRALSRQAAQALRITHDGKAHATEIQAQVRALGLRYAEVPVDILYHEYGQGFSGGVKIVWDLLKRKMIG